MSDGTTGGPRRGLRGALGNLGASLLGLAHTRLELAAIEFDEARERTIERAVLVLIAVLFFAFAVLAASALIVVVFWDAHRIAALACVTIGYVAIGLVALWRIAAGRRDAPRPFAQSLTELERDRAWLAETLGGDK